jgi:hypothetical protein
MLATGAGMPSVVEMTLVSQRSHCVATRPVILYLRCVKEIREPQEGIFGYLSSLARVTAAQKNKGPETRTTHQELLLSLHRLQFPALQEDSAFESFWVAPQPTESLML